MAHIDIAQPAAPPRAPQTADGRQFFELTNDETVIGRDQFCDIVLRNHTVSRQHARFVRTGDGFFVEDLSSLNGTFLSLREAHLLASGDVFRMGNEVLRFEA